MIARFQLSCLLYGVRTASIIMIAAYIFAIGLEWIAQTIRIFSALTEREKTVTAMRLIDADQLSEAIWNNVPTPYEEARWAKEDCLAEMEAAQTVDAVPVVHGRWETNSDRPDTLICSVCKCGFDMWKHDLHNYCPNCGSKMDLEALQ